MAHALPGATDFSFVGVPPLVGTLTGAKYVLSARATSGPAEAPPLSVIGTFSTTNSSGPLNLGGFVAVPVVTSPAKNATWDMSSLALEASKQLAQWLLPDPSEGPAAALDFGDPFINETFARALQRSREGRMAEAAHLLEVVTDGRLVQADVQLEVRGRFLRSRTANDNFVTVLL